MALTKQQGLMIDNAIIPYDNSTSGLVASDVQSAVDEIVSTIPTGATVVSSGSNGNGYYRIWSDGFKEQFNRRSNTANGVRTVTFPVAFDSPPRS